MKKKVALDFKIEGERVIANIVFLDTGEIRQKIRSKEWLMKRVFFYELRTWKRNQFARNEITEEIEYEKE